MYKYDLKRHLAATHEDSRGEVNIVYENIKINDQITLKRSNSKPGVFRGLHVQTPTSPQRKIIEVLRGEIISIVLNLNKSAKDFGKLKYQQISEHKKIAIEIPESYAHGFVTLSNVHFQYLCIGNYSPENEMCISLSEKEFSEMGVKQQELIISEKDQKGINLATALEIAGNFSW